jgi:hypothetical protein
MVSRLQPAVRQQSRGRRKMVGTERGVSLSRVGLQERSTNITDRRRDLTD